MTAPNPFGTPQAPAPTPAAAPNPFGTGVPQGPAPQQGPGPVQGQGFGAPAPQQAVQQYAAPAPAQQYAAPAPQQQMGTASYGATAGAGAPPRLDPGSVGSVGAPPPSGDGKGAKLPDMYGRLVLVFPHKLERRPRNPQFITAEQRQRGDLEQDQLTATFVVLDSGHGTPPGTGIIEFGGAPYAMPPQPHTDRAEIPYVRKAMWINQTKLIKQLQDYLPQPGDSAPRMAAGRVMKAGPAHNDPWYLESATPEEVTVCQQYLQLVADGRYPHPLA